jgi:hypothetical protein
MTSIQTAKRKGPKSPFPSAVIEKVDSSQPRPNSSCPISRASPYHLLILVSGSADIRLV